MTNSHTIATLIACLIINIYPQL